MEWMQDAFTTFLKKATYCILTTEQAETGTPHACSGEAKFTLLTLKKYENPQQQRIGSCEDIHYLHKRVP